MQSAQYIYFEDTGRFLDQYGNSYTEEELDSLDAMERAWRESLPNPSYLQVVEEYGSVCVPAAKRGLKLEIERCKKDLINALQIENELKRSVARLNERDRKVILMLGTGVYVEPLRNGREERIKKCRYLLSAVDNIGKTGQEKREIDDPKTLTELDKEKAKQVPLQEVFVGKLRKEGARLVGKCPFHTEKTGSFVIYTKDNRFHCFSCGDDGDTIDFIMKTENIPFPQAVRRLLGK